MPYTAPKPSDLKARYPEFEAVPDATIALVIEEVGLTVGNAWFDSDQQIAALALTAHILASEGRFDAESNADMALLGPVISESLGDASRTFAQKASVVGLTGLSAELATTVYGQRFLAMMRRNISGPVLIA